jgi:hypothetical protein
VSQCKFILKYIMRRLNFREFIIFFQKGLNAFKIQVRFKFEFVPELVTCNSKSIYQLYEMLSNYEMELGGHLSVAHAA